MFRRTACSAALLTLLFSFSLSTALPQERATLTGTVKDVQTGEPLPGATVQVQNTGLGASTDMDGRFVIRNVLPGSSTLRAVYVGYLEKELKVEIKEGETQKQNIWLTAVGIESEEVVVTVQAGGQKAAINQQLSALPIVNVVSRARIQELPDANAAESVSRLPGVSLIRTGGEGSQVVIRGLVAAVQSNHHRRCGDAEQCSLHKQYHWDFRRRWWSGCLRSVFGRPGRGFEHDFLKHVGRNQGHQSHHPGHGRRGDRRGGRFPPAQGPKA